MTLGTVVSLALTATLNFTSTYGLLTFSFYEVAACSRLELLTRMSEVRSFQAQTCMTMSTGPRASVTPWRNLLIYNRFLCGISHSVLVSFLEDTDVVSVIFLTSYKFILKCHCCLPSSGVYMSPFCTYGLIATEMMGLSA